MKITRAAELLLNILYWLAYVLAIIFFTWILKVLNRQDSIAFLQKFYLWNALVIWIAIVPGVLCFYSNYFFFFPRFSEENKKWKYILSLLFLNVGIATLATLALVLTLVGTPFALLNTIDILFVSIVILFFGCLHTVVASIVKGFFYWYRTMQEKVLLAQRNYDLELELIKWRLEPHFLFNTINNIDSLIISSSSKASLYLNQLSEILRFMLYKKTNMKVALDKEVEILSKYIDLQKLRISTPEKVVFNADKISGNWTIEPMLFIPFVENAFKHSNNTEAGWSISMSIEARSNQLVFECVNTFNPLLMKKPSAGIGVELITKRFEYLYPGKHQIKFLKSDNVYMAKICLYK